MRRENLPTAVNAWRVAGDFSVVDGVKIYYQRKGRGRPLVCFHGFPTSSWDWHLLLPMLAPRYKIVVFDFPGYGLSEKPRKRSYSLLRQMDAAEALLQQLKIDEFHLLSHDMGNSVACELLQRMETGNTGLRIRRWVMLNGGVYMDLHQPLLTQKLLRTPMLGELTARLSSRVVFDRQYPQVYARPRQFPKQHYDCQWALLQHNRGRRVLAKVAGYMRERLRYHERWLGPMHRTGIPTHLIWGKADPIAVSAIAQRLLRNLQQASITWLPRTGHYPQLEAADAVADAILDFLD